MLSENFASASHAGEDQSSPDVFAPRKAHWANAAIGLLSAAKTITGIKDITDTPYDELRELVRGLAAAVSRAEEAGMTLTGTLQLATGVITAAQYWSVINDRFSAGSLTDLIKANEWLRVDDYVYQAKTIHRHKLTKEDFAAAGVAEIGAAK